MTKNSKIKILFLSIITILLFVMPVYADIFDPHASYVEPAIPDDDEDPIVVPKATVPPQIEPVMPEPAPKPPVRKFDFEDLGEFILSAIPYELFIASWLTVIGLVFRDSDSVKKKILSLICFQIALSVMIIMLNALMIVICPIFLLLTIILLIVANVFMIERIIKCKNSFENKEVFMEKEGGSCK